MHKVARKNNCEQKLEKVDGEVKTLKRQSTTD